MRTNYRLRTANTINQASEDTSPPSSHRIKVRAGLAVSNSKPGNEMNLRRSEDTNFPGYKKFDNKEGGLCSKNCKITPLIVFYFCSNLVT